MSRHKEVSFESEICQHPAAHDWRYAERDAVSGYDRALALFPADLLECLDSGDAAEDLGGADEKSWRGGGGYLLAQVREQLDQRGTLEVLRQSIDFLGLRESLKLAEFKPALTMNPDILTRHAANCPRVVRQARYSLHHENSIDFMLFLNGIASDDVGAENGFHPEDGRRHWPVPF